MTVTRSQKEQSLAELVEKFKAAKSVVFSQNNGLTVNELQELRKGLLANKAELKVAKKTLMKIAAKEAGYPDIPTGEMQGPVAAVFSYDDIIVGAKSIYDYAKKHKALALLGGLLDGKVLSIAEAKTLATLPSKEELIAKLLYMFKYPITGFHGVLKNTMAGFVRALDAISKKTT